MLTKIKETIKYINKIITYKNIKYAIILGSGFKKFENQIKNKIVINYANIPHFPIASVSGHTGALIYGTIHNKEVIIMSGRFHYYEGLSMNDIVFPIIIFKKMGVKKLILTNASGGVNINYKIGDIMLIKDHINLMPEHPLRGYNFEELGPRFVDMHEPYNINMLQKAEQICIENKISYHQGVYVGLQGPTFETPAEYNMIKIIGGDAVGMSTIPETIIANYLNMKVLGISIITDLGGPHIINNKISHEEVLKNSQLNINKVILIIKQFIKIY
jgi:purine-nucleoside phosphorylase